MIRVITLYHDDVWMSILQTSDLSYITLVHVFCSFRFLLLFTFLSHLLETNSQTNQILPKIIYIYVLQVQILK